MKKNNIFTIFAAACLMAGISCVREDPEVSFDAGDNLERVPVTLSLNVTQIEDGTPDTKGIMEPEADATDTDSQIKDLVVLQFNGTTSSAQLVGGQVYFDHWPLNGYREMTDPLYDEDDVLTLVASGTPNTVVVLANTFGRISISNSTTLGEFLANDFTTISGLSGVFTPSGGNDYLRLSGSEVLGTIGLGDNVSVSLMRNVAKIVINVTNATYNKTGDNKVSLAKVQLRDVNGKYYYLAHVDNALSPLAFTDTYIPGDPRRFHNQMEDFPAEKNTGGEEDDHTQQYVYYVPANLRGTTINAAQSSKSVGAPEGSTYFCLYGTYGTSHTSIIYTYYLGENLTNDFNLKPNYKYTYNITIKAKGDARYDQRIEDLKEVEFSTDANCYIVQPPRLEGQTRVYSFPVRRAAVFWDTEAQGGLYGGNTMDGYGGYVLDGSTQWVPEIIWSDFNMSAYMSGPAKFLVEDSGTGFLPSTHTQPYIKVRISYGMSGNVVVGMKYNGDVLWSWHIWITDYDPDVPMTKVDGQYIYAVPGGEIHRYNSGIWNTGIYSNGFAMDRNLGAMDTKYHTTANGGNGHFYQFGRKDPFSSRATFYLGGTSSAEVLGGGRYVINYNARADMKNIRYSVLHPEVIIYGGNTNSDWTVRADDVGEDGGSYSWNDKFIARTGDSDRHELNKSIYDPCPPGWEVPADLIWDDFSIENDSNRESQTYRTVWDNGGRYYYPRGYVNRDATGSVFLPAGGHRSGGTGPSVVGGYGEYWTSRLNTEKTGFNLFFNPPGISTSGNSARSTGYLVRCVRK